MKRLYLSSKDKKISGLCAGIAEYYNLDPSLVRLGWIVVTILTGILPGILAYIVAVMVIPKEEDIIKDTQE